MSTTAAIDRYASDQEEPLQYRALYSGSIVGLALGVLSVFTVVTAASSFQACLLVTPLPVLGMFVSLRSWAKIRHESDQYTGGKLALAGFVLSLVFLVTGVGYGATLYVSEVPDGYVRISFDEMKPDELEERAGLIVPPDIAALNGKHVFIKGYIRPGSAPVRTGIDRFLLVRDNQQCCFGDLSKVKYHDLMAVQMVGSLRVDDTSQILRLGGILHIFPQNLQYGPGYPVFTLSADYVQ
jgi:hypothetical protein